MVQGEPTFFKEICDQRCSSRFSGNSIMSMQTKIDLSFKRHTLLGNLLVRVKVENISFFREPYTANSKNKF